MVEEKVAIFFAGTAGSGKSTLVEAFKRWMDLNEYSALAINLDPGAEVLAYEADLDVREWVVLGEVMEEFNLGPNGAQVVAADMMALQANDIASAVEEMAADYMLFDAPGQLELFAFRSSSRKLIETLGGARPMLAYLYDPLLVVTPNGFVTSFLLGSTVEFRFELPVINLLSKADLMDEESRALVQLWTEDKWRLYNDLTQGEITPAINLSVELIQAIEGLGACRGIIPVSAATGEGLEDLYSMVQLVYAGGDDLERR